MSHDVQLRPIDLLAGGQPQKQTDATFVDGSTLPLPDGIAAAGISVLAAAQDHVHPASGGGNTLHVAYLNGAAAADQTLNLTDADGGKVIVDATGAFTGLSSIWIKSGSHANTLPLVNPPPPCMNDLAIGPLAFTPDPVSPIHVRKSLNYDLRILVENPDTGGKAAALFVAATNDVNTVTGLNLQQTFSFGLTSTGWTDPILLPNEGFVFSESNINGFVLGAGGFGKYIRMDMRNGFAGVRYNLWYWDGDTKNSHTVGTVIIDDFTSIGTSTLDRMLRIQRNANDSLAQVGIFNTNVGAAASSAVNLTSNAATLTLAALSSIFNDGTDLSRAGGAEIFTAATAGLSIGATGGTVRLYAGGAAAANLIARITSTGEVLGVESTVTASLKFANAGSALLTGLVAGVTTAAVTYVLPLAGPTANGELLLSGTGGTMGWSTFMTYDVSGANRKLTISEAFDAGTFYVAQNTSATANAFAGYRLTSDAAVAQILILSSVFANGGFTPEQPGSLVFEMPGAAGMNFAAYNAAGTISFYTGGFAAGNLHFAIAASGKLSVVGEVAPGVGIPATPATIGGTGPTVAAQHGWLPITVDGAASFLPVWR